MSCGGRSGGDGGGKGDGMFVVIQRKDDDEDHTN
jgi:hypothetical protein